VGWSDLGWAMKNLSAVSMGRQFFWYVHQTKTHVNYILHKYINNKSKQNYLNYRMQMMLLKPVLCFIQQQEVAELQQIQPAGEQLSIVIGDECVGQAWWNYLCQYSAGVYLQSSYLQVIFIIKFYFPNLDWVGGS
jgi:hypothetical protein